MKKVISMFVIMLCIITLSACGKENKPTDSATSVGTESTNSEVAEHVHTIVIDEAVAATCSAEGKTEGKHCSVCNEIIIAQETIEKLPHTEVDIPHVPSTCSTEGKTRGKQCSVCKEITKERHHKTQKQVAKGHLQKRHRPDKTCRKETDLQIDDKGSAKGAQKLSQEQVGAAVNTELEAVEAEKEDDQKKGIKKNGSSQYM